MADGGDETIDGLLREIAETPYVATVRKSIRPGVCLAGRFFIEKRLGGGGMGQVFAAFDQGRRTRVATKILGKLTPETIGHMKHEFRVASDLVHPNLVRLHELSSDGDEWFFTMDLVEGLSLPECGRRRGWAKPPADWLLHVFRQLAAGLGALHQAGVLHRDLKPGNFLIGDDDRVTLLDFGLARPLGPQQKADRSGTPYYMAPEQALGEPLTEAADWYAFGVVLYEALTGGLPFGGPKPEAVADAPAGLGPLCLDLMALDPAARPRDAEVLQRLGVAATGLPLASLEPPPVLIGRTAELGALSGSFAVARAGAPAIALVHGPSGIGKTALVEEFLRTAGGADALVLRGRCRERESMSHKAVDGLIDGIVELLDRLPVREALALLPPDIAQLTVLFPALRAATAVARRVRKRPAVADRALLRRQAIGAFVGLLARFRERGPLCIFIDDLQWSDADSAALLGPVLGGPAKVPLLFIGSYRREAGTRGPLLDALFADRALTLPTPTTLSLEPLGRAAAAELARALLPTGGSDDERLAEEIGRDAGGHPLFIAELVRSAPRAGRGPGTTSLYDLVRARVAALPAEARRLLELAAVAGVPLPREALTESAAIEQTTADAMVDLLRAQRLAKGLGPAQGGSVDVHHDRIREIVAQALPDDERRRCHRRLAETLERREDTKAEVVAGHLEGAGEPERAARFWLTAADEALRALAFGHAARLYQRGLAHARLSPEEAHPIALRRAEALAYAGKGAEAARLYRDEAERASADEAIELRRRAAEQLLITGHLDEGLSVIEDVLRAIGMKGTRSGRRALLSIVGGRIRVGARGLRHVARPESAIPKAELVRLDASWTIACSLGTLDFIRGAEFQNRHILLALRAGEPRRVLRALTLEAAYAAAPGAGSARRSARLVRVAEDLARRIDEDGAFELLCLSRGLVHYLQGRIGDALPHFEEALAALARRSGGAIWETVTAQRFTISSLFFLGRLRRLQAFVPPLLAEAEANGNLYATMCFRASYGTLAWLSRDDVAGAWAELDKARADWQSPLFQLSQCNILIGESFADFYVGDFERAFTRLYEAWPNILAAQLHRISILRAQLHYLRAAADVGMADVLEARGDAAKAEVLRQDARVLAGKLRRDAVRRAPAWGGLIEAALAERAGNLPLARMALDEAAKAFAEQGMKLFAAAARARRRGLDAALTEEDYAPFREEGVVNPVAMLDLVAPGFRARAVTPPPA